MRLELTNGFGKVYLTIEYDALNRWIYNNWIGYQTYNGIVAGANACLQPARAHTCSCLLNDNRQVVGPWDHAVEWIVEDWAPRATQQGITHFAHVVSPESLAAHSAETMYIGLSGRLQMRMFSDIDLARTWLQESHQQAGSRS